jgi:hypothetical protein
MPDPVEVTNSCEYECISGWFVLIGGSAPEGYSCPAVLAQCNVEGDTVFGPPAPISDEPIPDDPPASLSLTSVETSSVEPNSASYTYDFRSEKLYFSSGKADPGFGFFPTLTLEQLTANYPSIAEEVSIMKGMRSLASFKVVLPALPASVVGRRDE